ncbi:MAG: DUF4410 domain-containing protein [Deltaproteobacteria bacterium]|nr:DUF4410 domain-containing protein [Deltaproteobacteria bacterium]
MFGSSSNPREHHSVLRSGLASLVPCLLAVVVAAGCASTKITNRQRLVTGQLPRPSQVLVYAFAATAGEVPADSALGGQYDAGGTSQTAEQIATGRQLGAEIAAQLVAKIRDMGLASDVVSARTQPQINDIVIRGYLLSVNEGSVAGRVGIGFGAGASELQTAVEGYQMTERGLRKLGSGVLDSGGSKGPGTALGAATFVATANPAGLIVSSGMKLYGEASGSSKIQGRAEQTAKEIAEILEERFQEQGWID